jgi:hypothetical protein
MNSSMPTSPFQVMFTNKSGSSFGRFPSPIKYSHSPGNSYALLYLSTQNYVEKESIVIQYAHYVKQRLKQSITSSSNATLQEQSGWALTSTQEHSYRIILQSKHGFKISWLAIQTQITTPVHCLCCSPHFGAFGFIGTKSYLRPNTPIQWNLF